MPISVLVTGATGFIGSHVAREMVRRGHEVHATVRPTGDRRRLRDLEGRVRFWEGGMDSVPFAPDLTLHLAWYAVPGRYLEAPENVDCLEASRRLLSKVPGRLVAVGTCFEFDTRISPLREDSPTRPTTLYARSKDALRRDVEARPDSAWVRLFFQYGPGEDPRRFVPTVIRALMKGESPLLAPGAADFLHVEDVASAIAEVGESRLAGCVNIGSGRASTFLEIGSLLGDLAGRPDLIRPTIAGEPIRIVADNGRLRTTGWAPRFTLESGLRHAFEGRTTAGGPAAP